MSLHPLLMGSPLPALVDSYLEQGVLPASLTTLALPRHPTQALVAFGGWSEGNAVHALSLYNPAFDTWEEVGEGAGGLPLAWAYMAAMFHEV